MPPVFAHGRLRLYLLKLLEESPRHGYEVIRLLEERFQGLYAPSAGTVYPRLAKLEKEGLVTHTTEGGRKVYALTDAGRDELESRQGELVDLEQEIRDSVAELAAEIRADVRGVAGDLRREIREAAKATRTTPRDSFAEHTGFGEFGGDWQKEWKEQARRAKEESRRAREEARTARQQAKQAQQSARDEMQRIARLVQEEVADRARNGDWQGAVREGLAGISRELGQFGLGSPWPDGSDRPAGERARDAGRRDGPAEGSAADPGAGAAAGSAAGSAEEELPEWAADEPAGGDPARDLERLLDRFRDDVRDAARDHGVTAGQLREARRHLSSTAAHIVVVLRRQG